VRALTGKEQKRRNSVKAGQNQTKAVLEKDKSIIIFIKQAHKKLKFVA
jgi:hypothetical protein